jgi:Zn-dependent M28 family amino/carboxypeptidase
VTRRSGFLLALLVLGSGCTARKPDEVTASKPSGPCAGINDQRESSAPPQVRPGALETHVRVLAHDSLQGRGTGTRGYDLAARYVTGCYADLGLKPAGTREYLQPIRFRRARAVQGSTVVLQGPAGRRELTPERDHVSWPDFLRSRTEVTAPVVLVGFGVTAPDRGYDDYRTVDARGKIVVLLTDAPASFPPTERAHYSTSRVKSRNAVSHGAVGVLVVRTRNETFPWDRLERQARSGAMRWLDRQGKPNNVFPELQGAALLSESGAEALFEGAPQSHAEVLAAAEKGTPPAFDLPVRATIRTVSEHQALESPNVAGLLPGSDPRLRDEVVVFTAHLDHLGIGEPVAGDSIYNGALDNASGSAALLEVARVFAGLNQPPRRSVLFLAVTGEEMGLLGSDYFAEYPTVPLEKIVANVNLDVLSILFPLREMVPLGAEHSTLDAVANRAAKQMGIALGPDPSPEEVFFVRSDQYSFVRRGVPSLFLFMGHKSDPGVDGAALLKEWFRTRYHTPQDDVGQPMNFEAGARHAQLSFLVGLETANAQERPRWKAGDFFGKTFGRDRTAGAE